MLNNNYYSLHASYNTDYILNQKASTCVHTNDINKICPPETLNY